jgi:hypothetical protein
MPTDDQERHRPEPVPSNSILNSTPAAAKSDRAIHQESRRSELDRIRLIDIKRRELLGYFGPLGIHEIDHLWDHEDIPQHHKEKHNKTKSELYLSHRVLVHAIEGYLLGCAEHPDLTAEAALSRATSTDSLIDLLQTQEDLLIRTFGPSWLEPPRAFSEWTLNGARPPAAGKPPTRRGAPSGTATPWSWPWR